MAKVSVIMPCFNAASHLSRSVGSLLAQSNADWELIAVDDGSTDDTANWLHRQTGPRILLLQQKNAGASAARNNGIAIARSEYLAFLDADDTWAPNFLENMIAALDARPDAVLAYCGWQNLGLPGRRTDPFVPPDYENDDKLEALFTRCRWPIHAALVRRSAVLDAGGFNPELTHAEDYALWLRLATSAPIVRVPKVLAFYHFHGDGQASSNRARAALQQLRAQQAYLKEHPEFLERNGRKKIRTLMFGELLARGYACYWQRDLPAARAIFRSVMQHGYGTLRDWKAMLPAWLPEAWHRRLIRLREDSQPTTTLRH